MAVTTSNGNGFALYNGVKLPNIDAYGGAFLWKVDLSSLVPDAVAYQLTGSKGDFIYTNSQTLADENGIPSATETWTEFINLVGVYPDLASALWSSIESSELYSEPIPLDGMNVIEWDGDTTGLAVVEGVMYKVSNVTDIDLNGCSAYYKASDDSVYGGSLIWQEAQTGFNVGVYGGDTPMCAVINSVDGLEEGLYFSSFSEGEYTTIFAYPASGGGSGDDEGDTSPKEKHYCRINGTVYEVEGGMARIGGTFCEVKSGTVLIDGTVYDFALN